MEERGQGGRKGGRTLWATRRLINESFPFLSFPFLSFPQVNNNPLQHRRSFHPTTRHERHQNGTLSARLVFPFSPLLFHLWATRVESDI